MHLNPTETFLLLKGCECWQMRQTQLSSMLMDKTDTVSCARSSYPIEGHPPLLQGDRCNAGSTTQKLFSVGQEKAPRPGLQRQIQG